MRETQAPGSGAPPKHIHPLDQHYRALQCQMRRTFETSRLAA